MSMPTIASLYHDLKAGGYKVSSLERNGLLLKIKRGLNVERLLGEELRIDMDMDDSLKMDVPVFEQYADVGRKATSILTIIKYLKKR